MPNKILIKTLIKLIKKNKYKPVVAGQKKLFNDLKKDNEFKDFSIVLKDLVGSEASKFGYIFLYSAYECELYKEDHNTFAKFKSPLKLNEDSKIFSNLELNLKKAKDVYGYVKYPYPKSQKQFIEKELKSLKDKLPNNHSDAIDFLNFDNAFKYTFFGIFVIPFLLFLFVLLPMDLSWETTQCKDSASWFSNSENDFLDNIGVGSKTCSNVQDGYSYPTLLKFMFFFAFMAQLGITGSSLAERVENKEMSAAGAITLFLISLPFVSIFGGFLLYVPFSGILFILGVSPAF